MGQFIYAHANLYANLLSFKRSKAKFEISEMCQKLRFVEFLACSNEKLVVCLKVRFDRSKLRSIKCLD